MAKEKVKHLSGVFASVFAHHGHITKEEAKEISGLSQRCLQGHVQIDGTVEFLRDGVEGGQLVGSTFQIEGCLLRRLPLFHCQI